MGRLNAVKLIAAALNPAWLTTRARKNERGKVDASQESYAHETAPADQPRARVSVGEAS